MSSIACSTLACLIVAGAPLQPVAQPAPAPGDAWRLVWNDEFDGPALDPQKWRVEHAALVKNNELQFYAADEVYLEDGCLVIRSRERELGGRAYTSGLVDTQRRFSQAFGRFEVRAMLPSGKGIWPAHWMLPEDHPSWPPELDIMELLGHEPDVVHMTQHWGTWPNNAHRGVPVHGPDFSRGFHTFALEWSPDRIDWYLDDHLEFSSTDDIPQMPFYLILNTAVGGDWPGNPDGTTSFPQYHRIDYVRVYARDDPEHPTLTLVHPNGGITLEPGDRAPRQGETVTAVATPDFGYRFAGWDDLPDGGQRRTIRMEESRVLTARFEPDPDLPPLLSRGVRAEATSSESADLGPGNAVDGLPGTRWSSDFAVPQDLTIDLGTQAEVSLVRVLWENAFATEYELQGSTDGAEWTVLHHIKKRDASPDMLAGPQQPIRFLRLHCTERATKWGVSVWEFQAYGRPTLPHQP